MSLQAGQQIITINILPDIARSEGISKKKYSINLAKRFFFEINETAMLFKKENT